MLAEVRLRQHKTAEALDAVEPALTQAGEIDDKLLATAGVLTLEQGDADGAVEIFERIAEAEPGNEGRQVDLAAVYLAAGRGDAALELLDSLDGDGSGDARRSLLTLISLQAEGRTDEALGLGDELLEAYPSNVQIKGIVAGLRQAAGDVAGARALLREVLATDRTNLAALVGLGRMALADARLTEARQRFRSALEQAPDSALVMVEMAHVAFREGDVASAINWLEKARSVDSRALTPRLRLTAEYLRRGQANAARDAASEAVSIAPDNAEARNLLGIAYMALGRFDSAADEFRLAIRSEPHVEAYQLNLARSDMARGDSGAAIVRVREILAANPDHFPSARFLANYYLRAGDTDAATEVVRSLEDRGADEGASLALRADILARSGDPQQAAALYDRALEEKQDLRMAIRAYKAHAAAGRADPYRPLTAYLAARPEDLTARMYLAEVYLGHDKPALAREQYEALLQANSDNVVALNNLAWILLEDDPQRAVEVAAAAYRLLPDHASVADTYGRALLGSGAADEARPLLEKAAEGMPENAEIRYHLGLALLETGSRERGVETLVSLVESGEQFESRAEAERMLSDLQVDR